jgi:hypothetical protein
VNLSFRSSEDPLAASHFGNAATAKDFCAIAANGSNFRIAGI